MPKKRMSRPADDEQPGNDAPDVQPEESELDELDPEKPEPEDDEEDASVEDAPVEDGESEAAETEAAEAAEVEAAEVEEAEVEEAEVEPEEAEPVTPAKVRKARRDSWSNRLYTGESGFDFVGKRKITYVVSVLLVVGSLALILFKGLNFGIDFAGGNTFEVPAPASELEKAQDVVQQGLDSANEQAESEDPDAEPAQLATAQVVGSGDDTSILIKTSGVSPEAATEIGEQLAAEFRSDIEERLTAAGTPITDDAVNAAVSNQAIDATWGSDVSEKAVWALFWFLLAVSIFLRFRYRWGLVAGAMVALLHDLVVTAGIYALIGFEVTPATVIGMLTILGFSLYDTVVVFDKADENTRGLLAGSRMTFSEGANLAVNQTLVRSINTSIISLLPVAALLFVGAGLLGAGTLKDLALVLFVGMATGAYSSIFLAAPIACDITERRPEYQDLARRVAARRSGKAGGAKKKRKNSSAKRATTKRPGVKNTPSRKGPPSRGGSAAASRTQGATALAERPEDELEDATDADIEDTRSAEPAVRRNVGTAPKPGAKPVRKRKR